MITRILDQRLSEAQFTGEIEGLPASAVISAVMAVDLLSAAKSWRDLRFMFPDVARLDEVTWQVSILGAGNIAFNWIDSFGPVNLRLKE
jgi:hypothetical protein